MDTPTWFYRWLYPGLKGPDVRAARARLGLKPGDHFDMEMMTAVTEFQKKQGMRPGIGLDPNTASALGEREGRGDTPDWWTGEVIRYGDPLWDKVEEALGYDLSIDDLKRFQGNFRLQQTGYVDEATAQLIHDFEE